MQVILSRDILQRSEMSGYINATCGIWTLDTDVRFAESHNESMSIFSPLESKRICSWRDEVFRMPGETVWTNRMTHKLYP